MRFRPAAAAAGSAAVLLLLTPFAAHAAGCALKTTTVPVEMQGLRPMVTAKINGQPVKLLVDSGAFYNGLDAKFAAQQKLRPVGVESLGSHFAAAAKVDTSGIGGADLSSTVVKVPEFEFVGAKFNNVPFLTINLGGKVSGNLGQNFLHLMDNEYDLKNGVMRLAQPEGCGSSALAYWAAPGAAFSALPLDTNAQGADSHTMATITINGVNMRALFDTGSTTTFITARA
ncbi:pepsin/retropepsin-like aspartic protease family protein [Phenylobacterium sp.]|uniref:pepsin/retropepsin-like aspartic protease family protein n=1 Tax=Phenylobacterium sp. TaxID=1871053 RepID=UPI002DEDA444|nr:pepsin/retropepsin-like aspartic protease family protein [Phenylobacterium sp.]